MNVLALDLSLSATGVAHPDGTTETWSPGGTGAARLKAFRQHLLDALIERQDVHVDLVVIEGYAYGRPNNMAVLGELGGVIRVALYDHGVTWLAIPPANVKQYATGKGNAAKAEVLVAAVRRLGYEGSDDNQADALWLRAMALHAYDEPVVEVPATHAKALAKIAWPVVGAVA